ncbi:MAG: cobalt transporter CbiM [Candidatus Brocadiia bacterium]
MHIAEGVLPGPVLAVGAAAAAAGVAAGLRKMDYERVPRVGVLASAFFVASLVHVPVPPSSAHLLLTGLVGLLLGWAAFPALLVALFLQAVLFGFGGLTALGVNTVVMAAPAVACHHLFGHAVRGREGAGVPAVAGFAAGATGIVLAGALASAALLASGKGFAPIAHAVFLAHLPIMGVEGLVTAQAVVFLHKVRPEALEAPVLGPAAEEVAGA